MPVGSKLRERSTVASDKIVGVRVHHVLKITAYFGRVRNAISRQMGSESVYNAEESRGEGLNMLWSCRNVVVFVH
jgi:hypothetical protein